VPPFFLLDHLLFILLFDTFKFVRCHSGDAVYIIIVGMEVAILVVRVLPQMGYFLAATSTDVLDLTFLLFQYLAKRRHFPFDGFMLSEQTIQ
jgi:uncharacterized membrane protein